MNVEDLYEESNFTTPEQGKHLLLDLGLPADSADCYYYRGDLFIRHIIDDSNHMARPNIHPCWSVGRLIGILEYLIGKPFEDSETIGKSTLLERVLSYFESANKLGKLDFSKLTSI